jgi:hypothetical protein
VRSGSGDHLYAVGAAAPTAGFTRFQAAADSWDQHDIVAEEVLELACLDRLFEAS